MKVLWMNRMLGVQVFVCIQKFCRLARARAARRNNDELT